MIVLKGPDWAIAGVSAVIFDKDGTLIDSHLYWGEIIRRRAHALTRRLGGGDGLREKLESVMGLDAGSGRLRPEGPIALESRAKVVGAVRAGAEGEGYGISDEAIAAVFSEVHADFSSVLAPFVRPLPGVDRLLADLRRAGVRCALVTSDSTGSSEAVLRSLGLSDAFEAVLGRESCPGPKEDGLPALEAARLLSAAPSETICVGDAPADVRMAGRAGLKAAVAVATGQIPLASLASLTPYCAESLEHIKVDHDA